MSHKVIRIGLVDLRDFTSLPACAANRIPDADGPVPVLPTFGMMPISVGSTSSSMHTWFMTR